MTAPEPFASIRPGADDAELDALVAPLDGADVVAAGMRWLEERFDPAAAGSVGAIIQWEVTSGATRHRWQLVVVEGACRAGPVDDAGDSPRPHVMLAAPVAEFVRVVSGRVELMERFANGHVVIAGNLPLARALAGWFPAG